MKKSVSIAKFLPKESNNERIITEIIHFLCFPWYVNSAKTKQNKMTAPM